MSRSSTALTTSAAASTAVTMARSYPLPCFGRVAGERLMVSKVFGQVCWLLCTAALHRSRASYRDVSGSPTRIVRGRPGTGVCLHFDDPAVEADQRDRVRAGETHWSPIPVTCTSNGFWSCCSRTPMASSRIPSTGSVCWLIHSAASWRSRRTFACVIDSSGSP